MKKIMFLIFILFIPTSIYAHQQKQILNGITIVLDAGHGGMDKGASNQNVDEATLNLVIVQKLEDKLNELGCKIVLTRENEGDLSSGVKFNKSEDMKKRIQIINDEKNDLFISVHMNQFQDSSVKGIHVFYNPTSNQAFEFATFIQKEINEQLNQEKEMKKADFYILNKSRIPGILIECGFLSNVEDRNHLIDENYQNKLVDCMVKGIIKYFEYKKMI